MEIVVMTPLARELVVEIEDDQQAFDEGISAGMDNWVRRDVAEDGRSMIVFFEDETETEYRFADPDFLITFIEYMDK